MQATRSGLYKPDDMLWKIHRENLVMLAGARALLLELAHPMIAAGVVQHSEFKRKPLHRLFSTLRVMQRLSFGGNAAVKRSARHVYACHEPVYGELDSTDGNYRAGTHYSANDSALRLWVFATLIDSVLVTYEHFVGTLTLAEREAYYADSKLMARMLGVKSSVMPASYLEFDKYVSDMVNGGALVVGDTARAIAAALFSHRLLGVALKSASFGGIGLLPSSMREAYGLHWSKWHEAWLRQLGGISRTLRTVPLDVLWVQPDALMAEMRLKLGYLLGSTTWID